MPQVKVWNDNDYPHSEKFKGDRYVIEPHQYIEMEADDAFLFLGQYTPITMRGDDTPDPRSFKKLRIEGAPEVKVDPLMCHANGKVAATEEELKKLAAMYAHLKAEDDKAENEAVADLVAENQKLRKDMDDMKALVAQLVEGKKKG